MIVLPVYNIMLAPNATLVVKSEIFQKMLGREPHCGDRMVVCVGKSDMMKSQFRADSFFPIGVLGEISEVNSGGFTMIALSERVNITSITIQPNHILEAEYEIRPEIKDMDPVDAEVRFRAAKEAINTFSEEMQWNQSLRSFSDAWTNLGEIAVTMSPWLDLANEERYAALAEDSAKKRFYELERIIFEGLEIIKVKYLASAAQENDYQKNYKEAAIRKQLEYLQKEMDEMHPENISDLRLLEKRLNDTGMNETAKKECDRILKRLKAETMNTAETGLLTDYLETMAALPWKPEEAKEIDLKAAEEILDADHFGLEKIKKRIIEQIAVMKLTGRQSGSILLFVGAPGTGKTSIGQSIAKALGREYTRVSLGGIKDESDIRGHRRTYIGAMPGRIIDSIKKCSSSNPVMVLDEVDKLSQSFNGDPASALLEVLDPEQNSTFTDHYLNVPYDLSDVFFVCTANTTDTIPEPLLNRMEVIRFQGYTPQDKLEIAKRHLLPKSMTEAGLKKRQLKLSDQAIDTVITEYTMESGVRGLRKRLDMITRAAAVKLVTGERKSLTINEKNVKEIMDAHPFHRKLVGDQAHAGIVTGLAYTTAGGTILYIETMFVPGKGDVVITGHLGDVMKESVKIAITLVKKLYPEQAKLFTENDLHIHVPDGATPKDGPSAGITLTTALSSLVSGIPVTPHVAMTGEVSLQGGVKAIGGLPEKLMAAHRAGVTKVFIPKENVDDLRDVAQVVKESIEIIPVCEVKEVLEALKIQ